VSAARRSLLTATAAGTLLGALWFVPSANATQDGPAQLGPASTPASISASPSTSAHPGSASPASASGTSTESRAAVEPDGDHAQLADTGSVDTTPYVVGGTLFLGLGAGFVTYSVRRERTMAW
jgi:hypothetical protein